jgi:phosphoribosylformimino-5-aminoimidazole carboxamide ribotide isomerase
MLIIPAIDLKDGHCVRLEQGRMDTATVFSDAPAKWLRNGPPRARGACTWWT